MSAGFEHVYGLVEKARLAVPVNTKLLEDIRDTYGADLYKEALAAVLENHSLGWLLAERLNDFYKDFDYYDYMDKIEGTEEDAIQALAEQLEDPGAVSGILDALEEIKADGGLSEAQALVLDEMVLDLAEVQVRLGKSIDEVVSEAVNRSEEIKGGQMTIDILQVKRGDEFRRWRFEGLQWSGLKIDDISAKNYDHIYQLRDETVDLADENAVMDCLEGVYARFNFRHPADFKGHSLSVSDVVVLTVGDARRAYFCDSIGFEALPESFVEDFSKNRMGEMEMDER